MRAVLIAGALAGVCVSSSYADDGGKLRNFDLKKTEVLKHIDQRIARNQEERVCVLAAANHEALKACHDTFKAEMKRDRQFIK